MDLVVIGIILIVLIVIIVVWLFKRKSQNDDDVDSYIQSNADLSSYTEQDNDHCFTLAELKRLEVGKYSWDETGCVFEINSDGSVTIVGHFDPMELLIDPEQEMYDKLIEDGLLDMLSSMWSFVGSNPEVGSYMVCDNVILSSDDYSLSIEGIKEATFSASSIVADIPSLIRLICKENDGHLFLLPNNEKEFLFALGVQSCIHRHFGENLKVRISSPAVMGALWSGILSNTDKTARISYAFSKDGDYRCCNMTVENGIYEVTQLLTSSIIQPEDLTTAINRISRSCLIISGTLRGYVNDVLLLDMAPYPISVLVLEHGRTVKIYDLKSDSNLIPTRRLVNDLNITQEQTLALVIGTSIIIHDIAQELGLTDTIIIIGIEIDADMAITLIAETVRGSQTLNIGNLIG